MRSMNFSQDIKMNETVYCPNEELIQLGLASFGAYTEHEECLLELPSIFDAVKEMSASWGESFFVYVIRNKVYTKVAIEIVK